MLTRQRLDVIVNSIFSSLGQINDEWIQRQCLEHHIDEESLRHLVEEALERRGKLKVNERYWRR